MSGWGSFTFEELTKRDKVNLDIFWLKDESLEDSANLPDPGVLALEITEDLEAALAQFAAVTRNAAVGEAGLSNAKQQPGFQIAADLKR